MISISYFLNSLYQRFVAGMAYAAAEGAKNGIKFQTLEISGTPDERSKVVAAYNWLSSLSPASQQTIAQHVRRIIVITRGDNAFLPVNGTIIFMGEWLCSSTIEVVSQVLARGAQYMENCRLQKKYRMWTIPSKDISKMLQE